jgi:hypothetical protein
MGEIRNVYKTIMEKPEVKSLSERSRPRGDNDIKDLQVTKCALWTGAIWLKTKKTKRQK